MDLEVKQEIKEQIQRQLQELRQEIASMEERVQTVDLDQPIGRLSRMDSLANQGIAMSSLNKARARLTRLEMALNEVDGEEFGFCRECGEEIALQRIRALPESTLCIHCAE